MKKTIASILLIAILSLSIFAALAERYPHLNLELSGYNHDQILHALERGEVDLVITNESFLAVFGNGKSSFIPDVVRNMVPSLNDVFTKENAGLANLIGENYVAKFNVTCMCIGIIAAIVFILLRVHKIVSQKKLGISQNTTGQIVSTVIISVLVLWVCFPCRRRSSRNRRLG